MIVLLSVVLALLPDTTAHADKIYEYRSYNDDSGELVATLTREVKHLDENRIQVTLDWVSSVDGATGHQQYILDQDLATVWWEIKHLQEETDYVGRREGNVLRLKGMLQGKPLVKEHKIDSSPFHYNPSVGLQTFVLSGQEKTKFWTLRPDNLSKYKMKADRKEEEATSVQGETVDAVRVKWGLTGLKSRFFSQTFWFRASDGLFLRSKPSRGEWSELVREGPQP